MNRAPYNPQRIINASHTWPFGRCETCGKSTLYPCTICGLCSQEANTKQEDNAQAA